MTDAGATFVTMPVTGIERKSKRSMWAVAKAVDASRAHAVVLFSQPAHKLFDPSIAVRLLPISYLR